MGGQYGQVGSGAPGCAGAGAGPDRRRSRLADSLPRTVRGLRASILLPLPDRTGYLDLPSRAVRVSPARPSGLGDGRHPWATVDLTWQSAEE